MLCDVCIHTNVLIVTYPIYYRMDNHALVSSFTHFSPTDKVSSSISGFRMHLLNNRCNILLECHEGATAPCILAMDCATLAVAVWFISFNGS